VFGSYEQQFGLPAFPFQGQDAQGGLLGQNIPGADQGTGLQLPDPSQIGAGVGAPQPAAGVPTQSPPGADLTGRNSPFAGPLAPQSPLVPGGGAGLTGRDAPPAAGIGQFQGTV
jgi:hypothetical protein